MDTMLENRQEAFDSLPEERENLTNGYVNFNTVVALTNCLKLKEKKHEQYELWYQGEKEKLERFRTYVEGIAEQFSRTEYAATKLKSWLLPNSIKLQLRKRPESLEILDEAAVIMWAKANCPDAVSIVERLSKKELLNYLKTTGEFPQGVELRNGDELSFSMKI